MGRAGPGRRRGCGEGRGLRRAHQRFKGTGGKVEGGKMRKEGWR